MCSFMLLQNVPYLYKVSHTHVRPDVYAVHVAASKFTIAVNSAYMQKV